MADEITIYKQADLPNVVLMQDQVRQRMTLCPGGQVAVCGEMSNDCGNVCLVADSGAELRVTPGPRPTEEGEESLPAEQSFPAHAVAAVGGKGHWSLVSASRTEANNDVFVHNPNDLSRPAKPLGVSSVNLEVRCVADVTCVEGGEAPAEICLAGDDGKVVFLRYDKPEADAAGPVSGPATPQEMPQEHERPVISMAADRRAGLVATTGFDGALRLWHKAVGSMGAWSPLGLPCRVGRVVASASPSTEESVGFQVAAMPRPARSLKPALFALGGSDELRIVLCPVQREAGCTRAVADPDLTPVPIKDVKHELDRIMCLAFDPSGRFLAASDSEKVCVWDLSALNRRLDLGIGGGGSAAQRASLTECPVVQVAQFKLDSALIVDLLWKGPAGSVLSLLNQDGSLMFAAVDLAKRPTVEDKIAEAAAQARGPAAAAGGEAAGQSGSLVPMDQESDSDGDEDDAAARRRRRRRRFRKQGAAAASGDDGVMAALLEAEAAEAESSPSKPAASAAAAADAAGDEVELVEEGEEEGEEDPSQRGGRTAELIARVAERAQQRHEDQEREMEEETAVRPTAAPGARSVLAVPQRMRRVQPGASLPSQRDTSRAYLAWNHAGKVTVRDDGATAGIEVALTSAPGLGAAKTKSGVLRITDDRGFHFAGLSTSGVLLAAPARRKGEGDLDPEDIRDDEAEPALLAYHSLVSAGGWASGARWDAVLPRGENPDAVAAGREWAAVATSRGMLRVFRSSGTQEAPLMLPGPVVGMVGRGPLLLVVCAAGTPPTTFLPSAPALPTAPPAPGLAWLLYACPDSRSSAAGSIAGASAADNGAQMVCVGSGVPAQHLNATGGTAGMVGMHGSISFGPACGPRLLASGTLSSQSGAIHWLGFSEQGVPMVMIGQYGRLFALAAGAGMQWSAVLDCKAEGLCRDRDRSVWPVEVRKDALMYTMVRNRTPTVLPVPTIARQALRVPLAGPRARHVAGSSVEQTPSWDGDSKMLLHRMSLDWRRFLLCSGLRMGEGITSDSARERHPGLTTGAVTPGSDPLWVRPNAVGLGAAAAEEARELLLLERQADKEVVNAIVQALRRGKNYRSIGGGVTLASQTALDHRVFHLASRLSKLNSLEVAGKAASASKRQALADRLGHLLVARRAEREAAVTVSSLNQPARKAALAAEKAAETAEAAAATAKSAADAAAAKAEAATRKAVRAAAQAQAAVEAVQQTARPAPSTATPVRRAQAKVSAEDGEEAAEEGDVEVGAASGDDDRQEGTGAVGAKRRQAPARSNPFARAAARSPDKKRRQDPLAALAMRSPARRR